MSQSVKDAPADTNNCLDCGDGTGDRCQPCRDAYDRECERLNAQLEDR